MVLPPNRMGGMRGENGTTLDDLLAQMQAAAVAQAIRDQAIIDALAAISAGQGDTNGALADMSVALDLIAANQGDPADTSCELPTNGLLCSILTVLTSESELGEPPASCPGFPPHNGVWLNISTWVSGESPSGPSDDWRGEFTANGQPASLYIDVLQPYPFNPEITFQVLRTTVDATNICVSWDVHPVGASILVDYWEYSTNTAGGQTTLDSSGNPPNPGSHPIFLDADQGLMFSVNTVGSTVQPPQPTVNLWIVRGAQG